jgi:hypothetical protein
MNSRQRKNPAELPASRLNSGAGTEKRPKDWDDLNGSIFQVKQKREIF